MPPFGECQCEGEGAGENVDFKDVDLEHLREVEQYAAYDPNSGQRQQQILVDELYDGIVVQHAFETLEQSEVDDRRERYAAPQCAEAAEHGLVAEREEQARKVHYECTARECKHDRQQDTRHDTSATVVDVGSPMVLYMSSRMMLASMTDRYRIITSRNENMLG